MTTLPSKSQGQPADNLDCTLRELFQAEMPVPWPQLMVNDEAPIRRRSSERRRFLGSYGRFAVAAAIGVMLLGYLALAESFPQRAGRDGTLAPVGSTISKGVGRELTPRRVPLPGGKEAILWDEMIPGNVGERPRFIVNVHPVPETKPRR